MRLAMPRSILGRLTMWYALSAFALILVSTIALYRALVTNLDREDQEFASDVIDIVRGVMKDRPDDIGGLQRTIDRGLSGRPYPQLFVLVPHPGGRVIAQTGEPPTTR